MVGKGLNLIRKIYTSNKVLQQTQTHRLMYNIYESSCDHATQAIIQIRKAVNE